MGLERSLRHSLLLLVPIAAGAGCDNRCNATSGQDLQPIELAVSRRSIDA